MGIFGGMTMGPLAGAIGGMFEQPQKEEAAPMPRRRGGLFGGLLNGLGGGDIMTRLMIARATSEGDYGTAGQLRAQQARLGLQAQEAEQEREALGRQQEAAGNLGYTKDQITGMRPEDLSRLMLERFQTRQFGPEGGSVRNVGPAGQPVYESAPWQRQIGRSIIQGGPGGAGPQAIYQGVEPIAVQPGGAVYGMRGDGTLADPGGAAAPPPPAEAAQQPNEAALRAQAADAIARGADPAQVNARLEQMLRGGPSAAAPRAGFPNF